MKTWENIWIFSVRVLKDVFYKVNLLTEAHFLASSGSSDVGSVLWFSAAARLKTSWNLFYRTRLHRIVPDRLEKLIILTWSRRTSSERSRRHILGRRDTVEAIQRRSTVTDTPVYYPTLSSQYFSHEYAMASIDGSVTGSQTPDSSAGWWRISSPPKNREIRRRMNLQWFICFVCYQLNDAYGFNTSSAVAALRPWRIIHQTFTCSIFIIWLCCRVKKPEERLSHPAF